MQLTYALILRVPRYLSATKSGRAQINDQRITSSGVIVIKAQEYRNQEQNRESVLKRLQELIKSAVVIPKKRKPSKPTRSSHSKATR